MPNPATENRLLDAIADVLEGIGTPAPDWLTTPTVMIGIPGDALPEGVKQLILVAPVSTEMKSEDDELDGFGANSHSATAHFAIWCISGTEAGLVDALNIKADVLRALWAAEGALTPLAGGPVWVDRGELNLELSRAGYAVWMQRVHASPHLAHTDP